MRSAAIAEGILRLMMPPGEAGAIAGDLLEVSTRRGRVWFWTAIASTALAFFWLNLVTAPGRVARALTSFGSEGARMTDFNTLPRTLWRHKWLLVAPAILAVAATAVWSYFQPLRYRSEVTLVAVPSEMGLDDLTERAPFASSPEQLERTLRNIQSHAQLERLIEEFGLYQSERDSMIVPDVISRMRRDITVSLADADEQAGARVLKVAFADRNPSKAMQVAQRLAALLVQENLTSRGVTAQALVTFLDDQVETMRGRLASADAAVRRSQAANGGAGDTAEALELELLKRTYTSLAQRREHARLALALERRMMGERLRVVGPAQIPRRPVSPTRVELNTAGAVAGLGLGVALVAIRARKEARGARS